MPCSGFRALEGIGFNSAISLLTSSLQLPVQIKGVADLPTLTTSDLSTSEGAVEAALGKIEIGRAHV